MTNFNQMRQNMILGQFLPGLIKNNRVLEAFQAVPRESFLPEIFKDISYSDLNIKIGNRRFIPSPFNAAKILQEANFKGNEVVLLIGSNYGYEAVVASQMVDTIIAIEEDKKLKEFSEKKFYDFKIENLVLLNEKHERGHKKLGPYDIIISLDPLIKITQNLLGQLVEGGKLFYCEKYNSEVYESKLNVYYKLNKKYIKEKLFDLNIPSCINSDDTNKSFKLI